MCVRIDFRRYVSWCKATAGKTTADEALKNCTSVESVIVVKRDGRVEMVEGRDHWYAEAAAEVSADCAPEPMDAEDMLFILYTSDLQVSLRVWFTHVVDIWSMLRTASRMSSNMSAAMCTGKGRCGVDYGHSYIIYGPLLNGATTMMFEGVPTWPDAGRFGRL